MNEKIQNLNSLSEVVDGKEWLSETEWKNLEKLKSKMDDIDFSDGKIKTDFEFFLAKIENELSNLQDEEIQKAKDLLYSIEDKFLDVTANSDKDIVSSLEEKFWKDYSLSSVFNWKNWEKDISIDELRFLYFKKEKSSNGRIFATFESFLFFCENLQEKDNEGSFEIKRLNKFYSNYENNLDPKIKDKVSELDFQNDWDKKVSLDARLRSVFMIDQLYKSFEDEDKQKLLNDKNLLKSLVENLYYYWDLRIYDPDNNFKLISYDKLKYIEQVDSLDKEIKDLEENQSEDKIEELNKEKTEKKNLIYKDQFKNWLEKYFPEVEENIIDNFISKMDKEWESTKYWESVVSLLRSNDSRNNKVFVFQHFLNEWWFTEEWKNSLKETVLKDFWNFDKDFLDNCEEKDINNIFELPANEKARSRMSRLSNLDAKKDLENAISEYNISNLNFYWETSETLVNFVQNVLDQKFSNLDEKESKDIVKKFEFKIENISSAENEAQYLKNLIDGNVLQLTDNFYNNLEGYLKGLWEKGKIQKIIKNGIENAREELDNNSKSQNFLNTFHNAFQKGLEEAIDNMQENTLQDISFENEEDNDLSKKEKKDKLKKGFDDLIKDKTDAKNLLWAFFNSEKLSNLKERAEAKENMYNSVGSDIEWVSVDIQHWVFDIFLNSKEVDSFENLGTAEIVEDMLRKKILWKLINNWWNLRSEENRQKVFDIIEKKNEDPFDKLDKLRKFLDENCNKKDLKVNAYWVQFDLWSINWKEDIQEQITEISSKVEKLRSEFSEEQIQKLNKIKSEYNQNNQLEYRFSRLLNDEQKLDKFADFYSSSWDNADSWGWDLEKNLEKEMENSFENDQETIGWSEWWIVLTSSFDEVYWEEKESKNPFYDEKKHPKDFEKIKWDTIQEKNKDLISKFFYERWFENLSSVEWSPDMFASVFGIDLNNKLSIKDFEKISKILGKVFIEKIDEKLESDSPEYKEWSDKREKIKYLKQELITSPVSWINKLFNTYWIQEMQQFGLSLNESNSLEIDTQFSDWIGDWIDWFYERKRDEITNFKTE